MTALGPAFLVDPLDLPALAAHLQALGWTRTPATRAERIVGGNMNLTVRVWADGGTFLLKQARPWVEKYPQIAAPVERGTMEAAFYEAVAPYPDVASRMPRLLGHHAPAFLLQLEDCGAQTSLDRLYRMGECVTEAELHELVRYLEALHGIQPAERERFRNRAMRALNHAHQYVIPVDPQNGLDLDGTLPGLAEVSRRAVGDTAVAAALRELGELYLADGTHLVHGDYFPGSWLRTAQGIRVIDPEFCFLGPAEYDLGVCHGHLVMLGREEQAAALLRLYRRPFDKGLALRFGAAEILRRLIGVAQLPLAADLAQRAAWLRRAVGQLAEGVAA